MSAIPPRDWEASDLAEATLTGQLRESTDLLLKRVAEMCDGLGCVLWRATYAGDLASLPEDATVSILAAWFGTTILSQLLAVHGLRLNDRSVVGRCIKSGKPTWSNDIVADRDPTSDEPFFTHHNISRCLVAPITYAKSERLGAIAIYRRATSPKFGPSDGSFLHKVGKLIPHLYRALRDRAALDLLRETGDIVRTYQRPPDGKSPTASHKEAFERLCAALQKKFEAVEVSVFVESDNKPSTYSCAFTTEGPHTALTRQQTYSAPFNGTFSSLALSAGLPIRVYDTQDCLGQVTEYQKQFPEFKRDKSRGLSHEVNKALGVPEGWKPQPHSLMVTPLVGAQRVHGFIRCWVVRKGAPFFSADDFELLQLVATQFSHAMEAWKDREGVFVSLQEQHREELESIHHQIKGPLALAKTRVDQILELSPRHVPFNELHEIRSILQRASLMSKRINLLTKLDRGEQLTLQKTEVSPIAMVRLLGEICQNYQFRIKEADGKRIEFQPDSILKSAPINLRFNMDLLVEAAYNLVDNAVKYSSVNSKIRVFGAVGRGNRFYVGVSNVGVPIRPEEIALCKQRLWRGSAAEALTGEGSGLGLWLADQIMKAHGGELQIIPTRQDSLTEVRLAFGYAL